VSINISHILTPSGPEARRMVRVPKVVGMQAADAVAALENIKLRAKSVGVIGSGPIGTVRRQDPAADTVVGEGAVVVITVAEGPKAGRAVDKVRASTRRVTEPIPKQP
jgi:beta-lactam-binding protein with PASTA domain